MTEDDWNELKTQLKFVYNTDNYFWDLKEAEILSERMKMLSLVQPYIGQYYSTEYIKRNVLKQTEEEINVLEQQMQLDRQRIQAEQMQQMMMQQQAAGQQAPTQ